MLLSKTYFDHEKLREYQRALQFVAFAHPIVAELPAKLSVRNQLERASTSILLNILVPKKHLDPTKAAEGKDLLVAIVSMLMGPLDVFGAQLHEDPEPYGARADSKIPAEQDHD